MEPWYYHYQWEVHTSIRFFIFKQYKYYGGKKETFNYRRLMCVE